jgi:hypothetical protein
MKKILRPTLPPGIEDDMNPVIVRYPEALGGMRGRHNTAALLGG